MTRVLKADDWQVVAASDADPKRATAFLLSDGQGATRVLDCAAHILFPPSTAHASTHHSWHPTSAVALSAELMDGVVDCPTNEALRQALRRTSDSLLSVEATKERIRPKNEMRVQAFKRNVEVMPDGDANLGRVIRILKETRKSVIVVAYVSSDTEYVESLKLLLTSTKEDESVGSRLVGFFNRRSGNDNWILGRGDDLRVVLADVGSESDDHDRTFKAWSDVVETRMRPTMRCEVNVLNHKVRADRYFLGAGSADIVLCSGHEAPDSLPADYWTTRASAVVVAARGPQSPQILGRIQHFRSSAVFISDWTSNRLWQQFTATPHMTRLRQCLLGLARLLKERLPNDEPRRREELSGFLQSVYVSPTMQACSSELASIFADKTLAGYNLSLPAPGDKSG